MPHLRRDEDPHFYFSRDHDISAGYEGCAQHYHNLFEIYYMVSGRCGYFLDNKSYEIESGDLILIPSGVIHKSMYRDQNYTRLLINCSKYYIPTTVFKVLPKLTYVYHNSDIQPKIDELFAAIEDDFRNPDAFSSDSLRSNMHNLFITLARNPNRKAKPAIKNMYSERVIDHIRSNFSSNISLAEVAQMCSVSAEHMSRTFKKETGFGFSEYLTHVRLQHSEYLLKNTELPITEIASQCGFDDSNYFSVIFKKNYGFPPRELRRK